MKIMARMWRLWPLLLQVLLASYLTCAEVVSTSDAVREAQAILSQHASTSRSSSTSNQQTGLTYYAKSLFSTLFLTGPPSSPSSSSSLSEPFQHALHLLEGAAAQDDADALYMLGEMNFYGNYSLPRNFSSAYTYYQRLSDINGNATAQHILGFYHATGLGGVVSPPDQAKALLYYTFAAEGGSIHADMAVAYRHHAGISTPRNCDEAVHYYKKVADKAMDWLRSGPPGNHMIVKDSYRLADEVGGVYGEGASVSSSGQNARHHGPVHSDAHASVEDVIEYLDLLSRKGDLKATFSLAKLYYDGSRGMKRDLRLARQYFLEVARVVWPKKGKKAGDITSSTEKLASKAAGFLGRMFLRAEGVAQDFSLAEVWFRRGVSNGDALSQYSMGIMYLNGLVPSQSGNPDPYRAAEYFLPAADQDLASAQVRLAALFLDQGDTLTALQYLDHAARNGHIEAYYYLAELSYQGVGRSQECTVAAAYYKVVAEKAEVLVASFKEANDAYEAGDLENALINYLMAAEQGFETAQANVAWILDQTQPRFGGLLTLGGASTKYQRQVSTVAPDTSSLALVQWTRSARQNNVDSTLKMGDYYLSSLGTSQSHHSHPQKSHPATDPEKAAQCYQAAAETLTSAQAYWNLGWMHENGIGMGQDFHLAKRFYDLALETNKEAYLPVKLALGKLRVRSAWNRLVGGSVKSIEDEQAPKKTWTEWLNAFLEAEAAALYQQANGGNPAANPDGNPNPDPLADIDDRDDWYNPSATPGGDYDELEFDEDGILESLMIIGAAAVLMILVVYRRRRQEERDRERQQGLGQQGLGGQVVPGQPVVQGNGNGVNQAGGLFPQPGDPAFNDWVVGGVGH